MQCRRILDGRNLVRVCNIVVAAIFDFMTVEAWRFREQKKTPALQAKKAVNLRHFAKSCDHPQRSSGYVRSDQTEGTGFKSC